MVEYRTADRKSRDWIWKVAIAIVLVLGIALTVFLFFSKDKESQNTLLPNQQEIVDATSFKPYFYPKIIPGSFSVDQQNLSYNSSLLIITLKNTKGQKVTLTEQPLPKKFLNSKVISTEAISGSYGSAAISYNDGSTVGTLLTKDKQTMVTVNSSDSVDSDIIKDLVRSLRPLE